MKKLPTFKDISQIILLLILAVSVISLLAWITFVSSKSLVDTIGEMLISVMGGAVGLLLGYLYIRIRVGQDADTKELFGYSAGRLVHRFYQEILLWVQLPYQLSLNWYFRRHGVYRWFVHRSPKTGDWANADIMELLSKTMKNADEIKLALGEMGHRLIDNPQIVDALQTAHEKNNARIDIVHGPRVDPETYKIFDLARKEVVNLHMMDEYRRRHFIIIKSKDGVESVLDEGVHGEALWEKRSDGTPKQIYTSRYRIYYFIPQSRELSVILRKEFENRLRQSQDTPLAPEKRPPYEHPYRHPIRRTIIQGIKNFPIRWFKQPRDTLADTGHKQSHSIPA